jgi:hypothetical protein
MKVLAAVISLSGLSTLAFAEVSEDLKFCGSRKTASERLACFEAVTRGASKPGLALPAAARAVGPHDAIVSIPTKAQPLEPLPARNPFDGYYAAIGGGYGVGSGRDGGIAGPFDSSGISLTSTAGPNINAAVGRNIAFGWGLVGLELDARWEGEKGAGTISPSTSFPNIGTPVLSYSYKNDAGLHAAIRVGATFDDLLVFAKAGLGATRITELFTADERNVRPCLVFNGGCVLFGEPGDLATTQTTSWLPSAVFGIGAEKNWGPVFARLGADLEAFNHATTSVSAPGVRGSSSSSQIMWTTRGTAMIGVRF